jgi:hypothetical protein
MLRRTARLLIHNPMPSDAVATMLTGKQRRLYELIRNAGVLGSMRIPEKATTLSGAW